MANISTQMIRRIHNEFGFMIEIDNDFDGLGVASLQYYESGIKQGKEFIIGDSDMVRAVAEALHVVADEMKVMEANNNESN